MSAERVVQAALYTALTGSAPYTALVTGGVHDDQAPQGTAAPYTVIGDIVETKDPTQDKDGYAYAITLHDFTGKGDRGKYKGQLIREARNAVLDGALLTVAGWGLTRLTYDGASWLVEGDEDDPEWHQITRYRVEALQS